MHNLVARLKKQGVLIQGDRRGRNQQLKIADEDKLRRVGERAKGFARGPRTPVTGNGASASEPAPIPPGGPRRVVYLEDRVDRVEQALEDLGVRMDDVKKRLDELIEMWS
jgi:hypothetical protein